VQLSQADRLCAFCPLQDDEDEELEAAQALKRKKRAARKRSPKPQQA
jgi:hypothetical protein